MSLFLFLFHASSYEKLERSSRWNAWTRTVRLQFYSDRRRKSLTLVSKRCRYWTCAELYLPSPHTPSWHVASLNTGKTLSLLYTWFHIKMFIYMFVNMSEYCRHSGIRDTLQQVSAKKQAVKKKKYVPVYKIGITYFFPFWAFFQMKVAEQKKKDMHTNSDRETLRHYPEEVGANIRY